MAMSKIKIGNSDDGPQNFEKYFDFVAIKSFVFA